MTKHYWAAREARDGATTAPSVSGVVLPGYLAPPPRRAGGMSGEVGSEEDLPATPLAGSFKAAVAHMNWQWENRHWGYRYRIAASRYPDGQWVWGGYPLFEDPHKERRHEAQKSRPNQVRR